MRLGDLLSPAMDVLNSIKVTVPPELREMLLEFVICYLIDRPKDPHSYAAAHFMYQRNLRHSHVVRYSHRETGVEPVPDPVVRKEATPPKESIDSILWEVQRGTEMSLGRTRYFPKLVRIIDDYGQPYGEKLIDRMDDVFHTVPAVSKDSDKAEVRNGEGVDETIMAEEEAVVEEASVLEKQELMDVAVVAMERGTQTEMDVDDDDDEEEEEEEEEEEGKKEKQGEQKVRENEKRGEKVIVLRPQASAATIASHNVVQLLHRTYQTIEDTRFSYVKQRNEPEEETSEMVEAQ